MKCVVVALALLCSAQALKMEKRENFAEMQDRLDRKHGRPLRSAKRAEKADEYTSASASLVDDWAKLYDLATKLDDCAVTNTNRNDIFQCAGEATAEDGGLNEVVCDLVGAYISSAEHMAGDAAEHMLAAGGGAATIVAVYANAKEADIKAWDAELALVALAILWWEATGSISDVQDMIDEWAYCGSLINGGISKELSEVGYADAWNTKLSTSDASAEVAATIAETHPDGSGDSFGDKGDAQRTAALMKNSPRHKSAHTRINAKYQQAFNRREAQNSIIVQNKWRRMQKRH